MEAKANTTVSATEKKLEISMPELKDLLTAGVQFGHQTQKWNPKMKEFIYTSKNKIHILDLTKTQVMLKNALDFLFQCAQRGNILFIGTKRQASEIVKQAAVDSGSYYVTQRWPGGLLTNFKLIQKSIKRLNQLEEEFEKGVTNRTKFEVSQQKKEWEKMNRIYEGIKQMERFPVAIVIVDTKYERLAVREARALNIPIVAMVDTNCDPTEVAYPVPANDDAIKSVSIVINLFAQAIKSGNEGKGVKHTFKDYAAAEIHTVKIEEEESDVTEKEYTIIKETATNEPQRQNTSSKQQKGILESIQENKVKPVKAKTTKVAASIKKVAAKSVKLAKPKTEKKVVKKAVKKSKKTVKKTTK